MTAQQRDSWSYQRCPECEGVWIETAVFLEMFRAAQPDHRREELMVHNDGTPRRSCPICVEPMDIAWLEFLPLEQCESHGLWFDQGELERALAYDVVPDNIPDPTAKHRRAQHERVRRKLRKKGVIV